MKQIKDNNILYVIDKEAYQITEDTDVSYIYVPESCFEDYVELNPTLTLSKYNYNTIRCNPEAEYFKPLKDRYLTIEAITDITVNFSKNGNADKVIYYSLDWGYNWLQLESAVTVAANKAIIFKSNLVPLNDRTNNLYGFGKFVVSGNFNVSGNPLSLVRGDKFKGIKDLSKRTNIFNSLFINNSGLVSAKNLSLHFESVPNSGYLAMFENCTSLVEVPDLPATTLGDFCYEYMFYGCTSLQAAQSVLPATTLSDSCYWEMFNGCSNLTSVPILPATKLAPYCYNLMFANCTSLVNAPELPATKLAAVCYNEMFESCTSLVSAPKLPATTLEHDCYACMFWGCTNLENTPELPAETLVSKCYYRMFTNCAKINSVTIKATNISASNCLKEWLKNANASATIYKKAGVTYPTGVNGIPSGWSVVEI